MNQNPNEFHRIPGTSPDWNLEQAESFEQVASGIFQPLYPYLIRDIETAWKRPLANAKVLELGGGPGQMALEFLSAGVTDLVELDISPAMLEKLKNRVATHPEHHRVSTVIGDACAIPPAIGKVDLIFSRGSIQFWPDLSGAFRRMPGFVNPGGLVYIGGGYGLSTPETVKQEIITKRAEHDKKHPRPDNMPSVDADKLLDYLRSLGGKSRLHRDGPGFWIQWFPPQP
jgi:SAM-dependent methyltransferase